VPQFNYLAFDKAKNRKITGQVESSSQAKARADLEAKELYVLKIEEHAAPKRGIKFPVPWAKWVSNKDLTSFYKCLMLSVRAGVGLGQVFESLIEQFTSSYFRQILSEIHAGITKGRSLSECFSAYPKVFPEEFVNMIQAGEASGKLAEVLEDYCKVEEEARKLRGEIMGAMAYPCVILFAAGVATGVLTIVIFPTFMKSLGIPVEKLPFITQMVWYTSNFLMDNAIAIILGSGIGGWLGYHFLFKTRIGRRFKDWMQLNFPIVKELFKKLNLTKFARTMALQSRSGVPSIKALELTEKVVPNVYYKELLADTADTIRRGGSYSESMRKRPKLLTPLVVLLIGVGEQTGTFDEVLDTIADFYSEEVRVALKAMVSMIEPLSIVAVGLVAGTIVASMFLPLFDMISHMS
jgi:type II secretory pathway component PulF